MTRGKPCRLAIWCPDARDCHPVAGPLQSGLSTARIRQCGQYSHIWSESWDDRTMDDTMTEPLETAPFAPFEWLLSARYLRARRREGFISVIAGFSFLGIMLGV